MRNIVYLVFYIITVYEAFGQTVEFRRANMNEAFSVLEYSSDCEKIIEIKDNDNYEFKDVENLSDITYKCNLFLKGQKVKEGSGKVIDAGTKVKDGVVKSGVKLKDEVVKAKDAVVKDTGIIVDASIDTGAKVKGGIIKGKDKAVEIGSKVGDGVKSFFKGIFD